MNNRSCDNSSRVVHKDEKTIQYFDGHQHEYSPGRLETCLSFIRTHGSGGDRLIDIGCGIGNILEHIRRNTPLRQLYGIDVSPHCVAATQKRVQCDAFVGSILDEQAINKIPGPFNFAVLAAVLHHLNGKTRRECKELAILAIANALKLLRDNGYLLIMEPTFSPPVMMSLVFYLKSFVTLFTSKRVGIMGYWNNIGAPVVSYYNLEQLIDMIASIEKCEVVQTHSEEKNPGWLLRALGITQRADVSIIVKKKSAHPMSKSAELLAACSDR